MSVLRRLLLTNDHEYLERCYSFLFILELPSLLPIVEVAEALLHVHNGDWFLCLLVANVPDSFNEGNICFHNNILATCWLWLYQTQSRTLTTGPAMEAFSVFSKEMTGFYDHHDPSPHHSGIALTAKVPQLDAFKSTCSSEG